MIIYTGLSSECGSSKRRPGGSLSLECQNSGSLLLPQFSRRARPCSRPASHFVSCHVPIHVPITIVLLTASGYCSVWWQWQCAMAAFQGTSPMLMDFTTLSGTSWKWECPVYLENVSFVPKA